MATVVEVKCHVCTHREVGQMCLVHLRAFGLMANDSNEIVGKQQRSEPAECKLNRASTGEEKVRDGAMR